MTLKKISKSFKVQIEEAAHDYRGDVVCFKIFFEGVQLQSFAGGLDTEFILNEEEFFNFVKRTGAEVSRG